MKSSDSLIQLIILGVVLRKISTQKKKQWHIFAFFVLSLEETQKAHFIFKSDELRK